MTQADCPPGPSLQSPLNLSSKDKFILVLNLPLALRRLRASDPSIDIDTIQMSVFGTVVPQISVPAIDERHSGQSVKFSSLARPEYAPLAVSFIVDNKYQNYYLLWRWLNIYNEAFTSMYNSLNKPEAANETEYQTTFSLFALNEYNKPAIEFRFHNAFITSLGPINYNYKDAEQVEASAEFTFNQLIVVGSTSKQIKVF